MALNDRRTAIARAYQTASRVVSVAIGMIVPGFVGYAIDERLGVTPLLTLIGFAAGLSYGIWRLVELGKARAQDTEQR